MVSIVMCDPPTLLCGSMPMRRASVFYLGKRICLRKRLLRDEGEEGLCAESLSPMLHETRQSYRPFRLSSVSSLKLLFLYIGQYMLVCDCS